MKGGGFEAEVELVHFYSIMLDIDCKRIVTGKVGRKMLFAGLPHTS